MADALKPCPFCGERNASVCERDYLHFVMCDNCTAEGPAMEGAQSRLDAAKEWNRRAAHPATVLELIAEVERLSAALQARIEEGKDNA